MTSFEVGSASQIFASWDRNNANTSTALDVLVLSELAGLYYADCVTITLLLRSLIQVFLSPPVHLGLHTPVPNPRSHLSLILFSTFLSLLLHIFGGRPAADERGYLHGLVAPALTRLKQADKLCNSGILVDFVGSPATTSIWQLILFDLVIGFLQLLTLTATIARHEIGGPSNMIRPQDHNTEERGVRRSVDAGPGGREDPEDIELQTLFTEAGPHMGSTTSHPLDRYYSGDMLILELNILDIKRQFALEPGRRIDQERMRAVFGTLLSRQFHAPST